MTAQELLNIVNTKYVFLDRTNTPGNQMYLTFPIPNGYVSEYHFEYHFANTGLPAECHLPQFRKGLRGERTMQLNFSPALGNRLLASSNQVITKLIRCYTGDK